MDWFWAVVGFMTADEWQASGTIATFMIAVIAAFYAYRQVGEARRSREEQSRPYVAVFLELTDGSILDLVVKNFGATTARNITLTSDIPMERVWGDEIEELLLFDQMPVLVPGQEWRTLFDAAGMRIGKNDDIYTITVRSEDSRLKALPDELFVLDWHMYENRIYSERKTMHDIGTALGKIAATVPKWTDRSNNGIGVVTRDGDSRDRRWEEQRPARAAHAEEALKRLRPNDRSNGKPGAVAPSTPEPQAKVKRTQVPKTRSTPKKPPPPVA